MSAKSSYSSYILFILQTHDIKRLTLTITAYDVRSCDFAYSEEMQHGRAAQQAMGSIDVHQIMDILISVHFFVNVFLSSSDLGAAAV